MRTILLATALTLVACGDDAMTTLDAPANDAAMDGAPTGLPTTCTGACATTALTATFMATRTLAGAYFGINRIDGSLHVEIYGNGPADCPDMSSTSDYTLILANLAKPTTRDPFSSVATFLDLKGDMLAGLNSKATAATHTPVAFADGALLALDTSITFADGTITGHLAAKHCASLDD